MATSSLSARVRQAQAVAIIDLGGEINGSAETTLPDSSTVT